MAKQKIEIELAFGADTQKAKASLADLSNQLNKFMSQGAGELKISSSMKTAQEQAAKLGVALKEAVNVDTGKFDLSKFQNSLHKSGTDLQKLRDSLVKAGPEGTKTFMALADSIVKAEIPTKRINEGLAKMAKTLKDTARWQLSSNIMHGLESALSSAYGYAQDLNRSLNDIRIVTGYSTDYMEDFAVAANKAARALSTTTNEYAKASLIYFQQGLSDEEVTRRTETTIKMANVTGEAAEDVSSYMTAIWNNFDNGTKKLEYYADAVTALGAATASSSEEIATGLQKFSAVANTVGLSYEYATAALATVTSETRESAETVGTAFKTIFARLESLSLGETLDDDTTMTKYSQALATVGVNIKTANGDLKDMDDIIDEVGSKWNQISKDQQVALAQTVAGMRQYNNFIALMDNYEGFKANVDIAVDAEGTLEEQAETYAESWEAARDRVEAAAETIYQKLLDDDFFIDLLNNAEKLLGLLDRFIDSVGGLGGLMSGLSAILLKTFSAQAAKGLEDMVYNMKSFVGLTRKEALSTKEKAANLTQDIVGPTGEDTPVSKAYREGIQTKIALQLEYAQKQQDLSDQQMISYEYQMKALDEIIEKRKVLAQLEEQAENEASAAGAQAYRAEKEAMGLRAGSEGEAEFQQQWALDLETFDKEDEIIQKYDTLLEKIANATEEELAQNFKDAYKNFLKEVKETIGEDSELYKELNDGRKKDLFGPKGNRSSKRIKKTAKQIRTGGVKEELEEKNKNRFKTKRAEATNNKAEDAELLDEAIDKRREKNRLDGEGIKLGEKMAKTSDNITEGLNKEVKSSKDYYQAFVNVTQAVSSLTFAFNSLSSIQDTLTNPNLTGWEKFGSIMTTLGTTVGMLMSAWSSLNSIQAISDLNLTKRIGLQMAELALNKKLNDEEKKKQIIEAFSLTQDQAEIVLQKLKEGASLKEALLAAGLTKAKAAEAIANATKTTTDGAETAGIIAKTLAYLGLQGAMLPVLAVVLAIIAAAAILILSITAITNALNADANAAKSAQEQLNGAKKALEETKTAYEEIKTALEDYTSAYDTLEKMQKGTEEWKNAAKELNDQIVDLINKYPELSKYFNFKDGVFTIEEGAEDDINTFMEQQIASQERGVTALTIANNRAQARADTTDFKRHEGDWYNAGNWWANIGAATAIGTNVGAMGGPLGAIAGMLVGGVTGLTKAIVENGMAVDEMETIIDTLSTQYANGELQLDDNSLRSALMSVSDGNTELVNHLMENVDATRELVKTNGEVKQSNELLTKQLIGEANADAINNSAYGEYIAAYGAQDFETKKQAYAEEYGDSIGEYNAETAQEYLELKYGKDYDRNKYRIAHTGGDSFSIEEKVDGQWSVQGDKRDNIDYTTAIDALATAKASALSEEDVAKYEKQAKEQEDRISTILNKAGIEDSEVVKTIGVARANEQSADLGQTSWKTREELFNQFGSQKGLETAAAEIWNNSDLNFLEQMQYIVELEKLGEDVRAANEAWTNNLEELTNRTQDSLTNLISNYSDNESFAKLTDDQLLKYGEALDNLYSTSGSEAQAALTGVVDTLIAENEDEADKIVQIASEIDWTNGEQGLINLQNQLKDSGIYLDENSASWKNLVAQIEAAPEALINYDFEKVRKEIAEIGELVNDISFGDVISDEDFNKLKKYSAEVRDMFLLTAEGYRFIGDEKTLQDAVLENSREALKNSLNDSKEAIEAIKDVNSWVAGNQKDYDYLSMTKDSGAVVRRAESFMRDATLDDERLAKLGWGSGKELLQETIDKANEGDEKAIADLQKFYGEIAALQDKVKNNEFANDKDFELYASQFDTVEELEKNYLQYLEDEGILTEENEDIVLGAYNKQLAYIKSVTAERIKSLDGLADEREEIERLEKALERLGKEKDRVYGQDRLDIINQEIALTKELIAENEQSLAQANKNLANKKADLTDMVPEIQLGTTGNILNEDEILAAYADKGDEYDKVKQYIEDYKAAREEAEGFADAVRDGEIALEDAKLEKTEYKIELQVEFDGLKDSEAAIGRLEKALSNLSKEKDRAYGQDRLNYIAEEIRLTNQLKTENEEAYAQATANAEKARQSLLIKIGGEVEIDDQGNIANRNEILASYADKGYEYDEIKALLDNYDSAIEKAEDYSEAIRDNEIALEELALEDIEYRVEFQIELNQTQYEIVEWQLKQLERTADNTAEKILQIGKSFGIAEKDFEAYEQEILDLAKNKNINIEGKTVDVVLTELLNSGSLTEQENTMIQNAISGMMGSYDKMQEDADAINEELANKAFGYFEDLSEEYEKIDKQAESIIKTTQLYSNMIDIVGEGVMGVTGDYIKELKETELTVAKARGTAAKNTLNDLIASKTEYENIIADLKDKGADAEEIAVWEEKIKDIDGMIEDTREDMQSAWTDALSAAADIFQQEIENTIAEFEKSIAGTYGTLERLSEAFDQQSILNKQYVADYKKIYELSKLTRQIEGSINNTQSVKAKQKLKDLQSEITELQVSEKEMSEYDLEYLQKRYDLKLAEIALEEQQNAKSTVQLTRNAEGNWGYVYTADEDKTSEAQQNYEDKLYALQEQGAAYLEETAGLIISIQTEYSNAIQELYADSTLTESEISARAAEITKYYADRMHYATSEYDKAIGNNLKLYDEDMTQYSLTTGYKIQASEDFATTFEESVLGQLEGAFGEDGTAKDLFNRFANLVGSAEQSDSLLGALHGAYKSYAGTVSGITSDIKNDLGSIRAQVKKITQPPEEKETKKSLFDLMAENGWDSVWGEEGLNKSMTEAKNLIDAVVEAWESYIETIENLPETPTVNNPSSNDQDNKDDYGAEAQRLYEEFQQKDKYLAGVFAIRKENESDEDWHQRLKGLKHEFSPAVTARKNSSALKTYAYGGEDALEILDNESLSSYSTRISNINEVAKKAAELAKAYNIDTNTLKQQSGENIEDWSNRLKDLETSSIKKDEILKKATVTLELFKNQFGEKSELAKQAEQEIKQQSGESLEAWENRILSLRTTGGRIRKMEKEPENYGIPSYAIGFDPDTFDNINDYYEILASYSKIDTTEQDAAWLDYLKYQEENGFGTGGYTGAWGPDGKLAVLHEKEIVLNASDTKNFLAGIDILRQITRSIDLQAAAARQGLGSMTSSIVQKSNEAVRQEVTIHAEFPNATNHSEIEQAFDTLINRAAQYVHEN